MKKYVLVLLVALVCLTGCGNESLEEKITVCTSSSTGDDVSLTATYNIYHNGKTVNKVNTTEVLVSTNANYLLEMEEYITDLYATNNENYGGYTHTTTIDGDTLTSDVTIDYTLMDVDAFAADEASASSFVSNGKVTLIGLQSIYESIGAICE